jgi:hypothetical protein
MPGEEPGSTKAAPVVASDADQNEHTALRRLVGEEEKPMVEARARTDLSSELSSPPNSDMDSDSEEEEEEKEKNDSGRPNFRREKVDAEALKSDRDWFNRGGKKDNSATATGIQKPKGIQKASKKAGKGTVRQFLERKKRREKGTRDGNDENDNIFATPGKLGGALAGALSVARSTAAENSQARGTAPTQKNTAQPGSEKVGDEEMEGVVEEMEGAVGDEWLEDGANENMDEGGVLSATPPRFGSPTPSQRRIPVPRPVTPTQGKKRMACGTPAPVRVGAPRGDWTTATQVMAAMAAMEARLETKFASLIIAGEAMEKRLSREVDRVEVQRGRCWEEKVEWDCEQWKRLAEEMNRRKDEIEKVREEISALGQQAKDRGGTHPATHPAVLLPRRAPRNPTPTAPNAAPEVVMVDVEEDKIEEYSDMIIFTGQAWVDGRGKLATCRHRADSGGEMV